MNARFPMIVSALLVSAGALVLPACAPIDNDRLTVGDVVVAPALVNDPSFDPPLKPAEGASFTKITRDEWPVTTVDVSIDRVEHHPSFTEVLSPRFASATKRQRGEYPTIDSAFDLGEDAGAQVLEMVAAPFWGAADIVLFIPRALQNQPGSAWGSPQEVRYSRYVEP